MNDSEEKEQRTIAHYDRSANAFWQGTKDHNVSQNIHALLDALPKDKALDILDFGCGPGRDLQQFKQLGHRPVGLDGSAAFCTMAHEYSGCPTLNQTFSEIDLTGFTFDGIFANASLFHVPKNHLPHVLKVLHQALRPKGVLFTSNPRGNSDGWQGQRYGHYLELESSQRYLEQAGFKVLNHYYRPQGKPIDQQPWLAIISRRTEHFQ